MRHRHSVNDEGRAGRRRQLRPRRDGLSLRQGVQRIVGRAGDVRDRRRQLRPSARRGIHRRRLDDDESARGRCAAEQQGQARRRSLGRGWTQGTDHRRVDGCVDARRDPQLFTSRGLFAGISLQGTSLRPDDDATEQVYGRKITAREIITGTSVSVPASGQALADVLQKRAPYNQSDRTGGRR